MRLSDGFVFEKDVGLVIEIRTEKYCVGFVFPWEYCFLAIKEKTINDLLILKIESAQKELKRFQEAAGGRIQDKSI